MNKLLKTLGVALLVASIFSCATESENTNTERVINYDWSAAVGDVFTVTRIFKDGDTLFDYTGLGINDGALVELEVDYIAYDEPTNTNEVLLSVSVSSDEDRGNNSAIWNIEGRYDYITEIERYLITTDIYKQIFDDILSPDMDFDIDDEANKTLVKVTNIVSGYEYLLQGDHSGNGLVTVVSIDKN